MFKKNYYISGKLRICMVKYFINYAVEVEHVFDVFVRMYVNAQWSMILFCNSNGSLTLKGPML